MAALLCSLIVRWFPLEGHRCDRPLRRPWHPQRKHASFADMLATLCRVSLREHVVAWAPTRPDSQKLIRLIETIFAIAA